MSDMPTSPVTTPESQSPASPGTADPFVPSLRGEWRRVGAFLRRPTLAEAGTDTAPFATLARVYALDIGIMFALVLIAGAVAAMGVELPKTALAEFEFTLPIVLAVIIAAPVIEELLFRGWLSGRPGHVFALLSIAVGSALFAIIGPENALLSAPLLIGGVALALVLLIVLRNKPAMRWFTRAFPLFFWLATAGFALIHLGNFEEAQGWGLLWLLPLVLPQFALGALVGYVRVKIGLWAAMALHAAHNATALAIAALAMAGGEVPAG